MTYQEAIDWMFKQLPMYQNIGKTAYKKDLTNTKKLSNHLHNPEKKFKSIHVGGTNGKGSTSHMIASVLQEAGYKVGLYTSPHLKSFTERIRINGAEISEQNVVGFLEKNKSFLEENQLSFFEMTVGMAFEYFAKEKVDVAVIEVGLGGRLDSTNIITPEISVITNIGMDHVQILGDTLEKIAFEKAGIIKHTIPVVIGEKQIEIQEVFKAKAQECNAEIIFASDEVKEEYKTDLLGSYQKHNTKTAVAALGKVEGFVIKPNHIVNGLLNVKNNTGLRGRWEVLSEKPKVICDTAHNKEGLTYVLQQLEKENYDNLHVVLGVVSDKDLDEILPLFPKSATYYFSKPNIPRGLSVEILKNKSKKYGLLGDSYDSVLSAYDEAVRNSSPADLVFVGGSTFTVAEVL
ncbi:dihydrofolate synthase/folylpolyglutamate synthase [Tenacibaculum skagerrakense]|uniref:Dihydrofolate synthase/folylpolyglutamate synthase n=1 Tax=Tenacibaculum skagerrakense TaxID=186571 RepID=A0A4R2NMU3_9FLAO|nr:folylpolyglutamate synthase/dihydrofolate synthase family protein [Tenacibaculum skagerrakense]TCP22901.1 dihydrofolate synthase/folylpolyglutamate synthase [Tenacibaculum skagerrakense]